MIKPKWAYGRLEQKGLIHYPQGWDTPEQIEVISKRRVYYELKLIDWAIRHDLDGDGLLIKTILNRGTGLDRPFDFDEIKVDLKIFQQIPGELEPIIYEDQKDLATLMSTEEHIANTTKKILQSMKTQEKVTVVVLPEYFMHVDQLFV